MAVLVTDGDQRSTLAVVRSLGSAGIPVSVGNSFPRCLAGSSRYSAGTVCYPSPWENQEAFQAFLIDAVRGGRYQVLMPMTDVTLQLVSQIREALGPWVRVPIPSAEQVKVAQDKRRVLALAQQIGIPCPRTFMLSEKESLEEVAQKAHYPVVIKPRFSRFFSRGTWFYGGVTYARDPAQLKKLYEQCHSQIPFPVVQEKIKGEGRGVFLLIWEGEVKAAFFHRRRREKPPWGGASVYCESLSRDEDLLQKALLLLRTIGWQGVAMVEFKVDNQDGQAKLMEINGRFWGSLQLAIDAGVNFPLLLYRLALGDTVPTQHSYKVGVKSRWLLGDLDQLLIRLTHHQGDGLLDSDVSRPRACLDFLKFYEPNLHYEVLRLDDPAPGWFEIRSYFQDSVRRLFSRSAGGHAR
jgi:predicted ATP-grasp superfamily ATP-dependent carboligase